MPEIAAGPGITLRKDVGVDVLRVSTNVVSGRLAFATYAELAAVTPTTGDGTPAEVPTSDAGTHTDPVVGGTVDNSGIYSYSTSPAGWERIADVDAVSAEPFATAAAASATAAATSATDAAASAVEATALAHFLDTDSLATIDGVEPLGLIALRDDADVLRSFMAFMPDGTIVSSPIQVLISAQLAGAQFREITADGWGAYVIAQRGADGLLYAVTGVDETNALVGASSSGSVLPSYLPSTPLALTAGDEPEYLSAGWNGLITYGQSLSEGVSAGPALSTSQPYSNLTFGSGTRSGKPGNTAGAVNTTPGTTTTEALVEDNITPAASGDTDVGESPCTSAASWAVRSAAVDDAIDPGAFVIFASAAGKGSQTIASLDQGSTWYNQLLDHASEAAARASDVSKDYACHAVMWMQGEANTGGATTRAAYAAALEQLQIDIDTDIRALTGQTTPVHLLTYQTPSSPSGNLAGLNLIQLGQYDAIEQSDRIHFVSPLYHFPLGTGVHLTNIGQLWHGRYVGRAYKQLVIDGKVPDCIWPISATATDTELRVKMRVPQPPLVLDSAFIGLATDYGFKVTDGTGTLGLSAIRIESGDTVVMQLDRALGTTPVVRYALDHLGAGLAITGGASGNLRDSTTDTFTHSGTEYPLYHVAPHFELPIIALES